MPDNSSQKFSDGHNIKKKRIFVVLLVVSAVVDCFILFMYWGRGFLKTQFATPEQTVPNAWSIDNNSNGLPLQNLVTQNKDVLGIPDALQFRVVDFVVSRILGVTPIVLAENMEKTCSLSRIYHEKVPVTFTIVEEVPVGDPALNGTKLHAQTTIERDGSPKETFGYNLGLDVYRVLAAANANNGFEILVAEHQGFEDTGEVIGKFVLYSVTLDVDTPEITLSQEYESRNMTSEEMENFISSLWPGSNCEIVNANILYGT